MKAKRITAAIFTIILTITLIAPVATMAQVDNNPAASLTVKVGYFGGPYYPTKEFSPGAMNSLAKVKARYSFVNLRPVVCFSSAIGVKLEDLLDNAGIDADSISTLYFFANDSNGKPYNNSYARNELLNKTRYYYHGLLYDEPSKVEQGSGIEVPTIMAVSDDWQLFNLGEDVRTDFSQQNTGTRYRLLFGQTSPTDQKAMGSAKFVHTICAMLAGYPTLKVGAASETLKVGHKHNLTIDIGTNGANSSDALEKGIKEDIKWSSSNENVATVDKKGKVTVHKKGGFKITATYHIGSKKDGTNRNVTTTEQFTGSKNGTPGEPTKVKNPPKEKKDPNPNTSNGNGGKGGGGNGDGTGGNGGKNISDSRGSGDKVVSLKKGGLTADAKNQMSKGKKLDGVGSAAGNKYSMYEMSETAIKAPDMENKEDETGGLITGTIATTIFLLGLTGRAVFFFRQL